MKARFIPVLCAVALLIPVRRAFPQPASAAGSPARDQGWRRSGLLAPANARDPARYVGSKACGLCHAAIYERWKKTPMANVVRDPRTHPDAILA
ncbi:MAG: hypothetical protein ACRD22_19090, partial [Terriglobia bacterium]